LEGQEYSFKYDKADMYDTEAPAQREAGGSSMRRSPLFSPLSVGSASSRKLFETGLLT
jgi:hypothetical protein